MKTLSKKEEAFLKAYEGKLLHTFGEMRYYVKLRKKLTK